jgi:DegV family protein with EDD domain
MSKIQIVTDSGAQFSSPTFLHQHPVTVVPNRIRIGNALYVEGVDLSADEVLRLMAREGATPLVIPPSEADFTTVYSHLAADADAIISIHPSRSLSSSWRSASSAARHTAGHCEVVVIDSQSLAAGQGMLARIAAEAVAQGVDFDEVVRLVRGAVERVYTVFYVETIGYLLQNQLISSSHALLGTLLGIKPFLTIENGCLAPTEKVRTRPQAVERLVEFVAEFTDIDDVMILQNKLHLTDQTRLVQERLALEFPGRVFPHAIYNPSLAALLGPDALGVFILEKAPGFSGDDADL